MKQSTFFVIAAIILFILNGILIVLVVQKPNLSPAHPEGSQADIRVNLSVQLNLTKEQSEEHSRLAQEHQQVVRSFSEQQKRLARDYFFTLRNENSDSSSSANLLDQISNLETQKVQATYKHLNDIKSLLNEEQLPLFDSALDDLLKIMLNDQRKSPPPHRRPRDR